MIVVQTSSSSRWRWCLNVDSEIVKCSLSSDSMKEKFSAESPFRPRRRHRRGIQRQLPLIMMHMHIPSQHIHARVYLFWESSALIGLRGLWCEKGRHAALFRLALLLPLGLASILWPLFSISFPLLGLHEEGENAERQQRELGRTSHSPVLS